MKPKKVIPIRKTKTSAYLELLLFMLAFLLFYNLLKPLLNIFLASIVLTYVFYPLYVWLKKRLKYDFVSILATLLIIVLLFLMPFVFIASQIPKQASYVYGYAKSNLIGKNFPTDCKDKDTLPCNMLHLVTGSGFFKLDEIIDSIFRKISEAAAYIVVMIPRSIAAIAISLFISFFLFKDGKKLLYKTIGMLPITKEHSDKLIKQFGDTTYSVVYAHIIAAIVQGLVGMAGFYLFDIPSPIFWGVIMAILALFPLIGPALVWIPAALLKIANGIVSGSYFDLGMGIGLLAYGFLAISTIDNLLRINIIGKSNNIHPLTVLVGIIGGISLFGLPGIFIGPILISLLLTFFEEFSGMHV